MNRFALSFLLFLLSLPWAGCGETAPPPGFPGDTVPPILEGSFCVPTGNGFFDATVSVLDSDSNVVAQATTDYEGGFKIDELSSGTYTVEAARGHHLVSHEIDYDEEAGMRFDPVCGEPADGERVIVEGEWDSVEIVVGGLGYSFNAVGIESEDPELNYLAHLLFPDRLEQFDTIYFNSGMDGAWRADEAQVISNLTNFVASGGSLYASDTAYWIVEQIDPDAIEFEGEDLNYQDALIGEAGILDTTVLSPGLDEAFPGGVAELKLTEGFALMTSVREDVEILLASDIQQKSEKEKDVRPIAVRWKPFEGGGTIVFTSFHNHQDIDSYGWNILFEMVTSL